MAFSNLKTRPLRQRDSAHRSDLFAKQRLRVYVRETYMKNSRRGECHTQAKPTLWCGLPRKCGACRRLGNSKSAASFITRKKARKEGNAMLGERPIRRP